MDRWYYVFSRATLEMGSLAVGIKIDISVIARVTGSGMPDLQCVGVLEPSCSRGSELWYFLRTHSRALFVNPGIRGLVARA